MIHKISANNESFQSVEFSEGLNIILAERTDTSSERDTRNGLGKSLLIEIINFCLGSSAKRGKGVCVEPLNDWAFTIEITISGNRVKATRYVSTPNIFIIEGSTTGWVEQPDFDEENENRVLNLERWKSVLGWAQFGIEKNDSTLKYKPSYRSLISYFIRNHAGAYLEPFKHFQNQKTWDKQIHIAFLLGLNWEFASKLQGFKDQENALKALADAIKTGAIEGVIGSIGELEAERVQLQSLLDEERIALDNFNVHQQYGKIEQEANNLTKQIHELTNQNIIDSRKLNLYKNAINEETPPSENLFEELYDEMNVVFPDNLQKSIDEAREFHSVIIENRKAYLEVEILTLTKIVIENNKSIKELSTSRAELLSILKTHGAFEEYTSLQERYLEIKEKHEYLKKKIADIRGVASRKREIRLGKVELIQAAEQDYNERQGKWENALRIFNEYSQALYEMPGSLAINITDTGYQFDVEIQRSDSEGVGKMKIFCFDLMASELQNNRVDFLIHDSIIFNGVDSRQVALAIELAGRQTLQHGKQYICTINSDMIPTEDFSEDFNIQDFVKLRLTDRDPSGSLFGFRF